MNQKEMNDELLTLLRERWEEAPRLRFVQLLVTKGIVTDNSHNWEIEDAIVLERLKDSLRR